MAARTHLQGARLDNWFTRRFGLVVYRPLCRCSLTGERAEDRLTVNRTFVTCAQCKRQITAAIALAAPQPEPPR